ncbi:DUF4910 domain-containing protein [Kroppenstedtia pulmonis]|uniref:DUF4910 domain-containing protein n=1 Tax=Kroppenstedtia pulmonis TaxID=1380685 RepID=A0A7D3XHK7_9BACL|nr:M20/M25/M40 family metallo-hydrolase [Kroppenstedtia pulmonis]QKG83704.1 DUF4910 domain-containing protein [Kroppenstedtia pulmonis]
MKRNLRWVVTTAVLAVMLAFTSSAYAAAPIQNQSVADKVSPERIYNHIAKLAAEDNARVTGFKGEHKAADYIVKKLDGYGLDVDRQYFPVLAFMDNGSELTVNAPVQKKIESSNFNYTRPTPAEGLTREVVDAGLGTQDDFAGIDAKGKIALIKRGDISFYDKAQNAAKAGADGAIIFNNTSGVLSGTLGEPSDIPVIGLGQATGEELKTLVQKDAPVEITMKVDVELKPSYSQNVVGTIKAKKGNEKNTKTIIVGAHYDGVNSPAANDNASGTATLLELSKALAKKNMHHNVKVIFFGAEEIGLVGSQHYVNTMSNKERQSVAAMINMDMVGVGHTLNILTAKENEDSFVADMAANYVKTYGYQYDRGYSTRSDHAPFSEAGIPVAFLHYSPDPYYHTKEDTIDKIDKGNLERTGTLATILTYNLANTKQLPQEKPVSIQKSSNKQLNNLDLR